MAENEESGRIDLTDMFKPTLKGRVFRSMMRSGMSALVRILAGLNLISIPVQAGTERKASLVHDNLERTFIIHTPPAEVSSSQMPLVIALHGKGATGESMVIVTRGGFNKLADTEGFIVTYPDAVEKNWNDGRTDEEANDRAHLENIDDVGFISALIDFMIREYGIDPGRVYVTGISNGAVMTYRLGFELSGRLAAIAPVDGNIPFGFSPGSPPVRHVSLLAVNNVDDPLVPYAGGEIYSHFHRVKLGRVMSAEESTRLWKMWNNCSSRPVVTIEPDRDPNDGTRVTRTGCVNTDDGTEVILYSIDGGGHTWPGGFQYLPVWVIGKTSRDINASDVIWSFFKRHRI